MMNFQNHSNDTNHFFEIGKHPKVRNEIATLSMDLNEMPGSFKREMVVSYLRDHSLRKEWTIANPILTRVITSGLLITIYIESLFSSSQKNPGFLSGLEKYLFEKI